MPSGKMSDKELVMENEAKDFKDLDEEYLELLIKLAFDLDDLEKAQQTMEDADTGSVTPSEESIKLIWKNAQEKAERLKQEKKREQRRIASRRIIPQVLKFAACILLVFSLGAPVVIATSAEIRSKVIQMLVNIDRNDEVAYYDFVENSDRAFAVPEGWTGDYFVSYIPEGMEEIRKDKYTPLIEYKDMSETATVYRGFSFSECTEGDGIAAGLEDGVLRFVDVNGSSAGVIEGRSSDGKYQTVEVTWANDERMFDVTCNDMTVDEALAIARSVRKIIPQ